MNVIAWIYVVVIAFSLGHAIGWHRGSNYEIDRTEARLRASTEGASAPVSLQTTEEPMCPSDASTRDAPS